MKNPISNLLFDWISVLHAKAEGINAYDKYLVDAEAEHSQECIDLFNILRDQDIRMIETISRHIGTMFADDLRLLGVAQADALEEQEVQELAPEARESHGRSPEGLVH